MNKIIAFLTLALLILAISCKKEAAPEQVVLKFWVECGQCIQPEEVATFTLAENGLFDQKNNQMADSLFQAANALNAARPSVLCDSGEGNYGCGSCYDAETFYLQSTCGNADRTWQFDPLDQSQPLAVQAFAQQLKDVYRKCSE